MIRKLIVAYCVLSIAYCAIPLGICQEEEAKQVTQVEIRNNRFVSTDVILSKVKTKPGDTFSQKAINEDIKRLYATGFFTDVTVDLSDYEGGLKVAFIVTEKAVVDKILFKGNTTIKEDKILKEIETKTGSTVDHRQISKDIDKIKDLYQKKGFSLAKIEYKVDIEEATNKATVLFNIDEGLRYRIQKITITGNWAVPKNKILKIISTRPDTLFTSGFYDEEKFNEDIEKIKSFYQKEGYSDAELAPKVEYDEKLKKIFITIDINEGKKYLVGYVEIFGSTTYTEEQIKAKLKMTSGKPYSQQALQQDIIAIQSLYFEKGFMDAGVDAKTVLNEQTKNIDIAYTITENEVSYVNKILIKGNTKTRDKVIRRELRIYPGDKFDGPKLKRSKERLYNLGYFEEVIYETQTTDQPAKKDLIVNVKETKTGEFSFGGGWSSVDKIIGFVEITQNNFDLFNFPTFTGAGQKLRLRGEFGSIRRNYEIGFIEPYIFDQPYSFGFDIFSRERKRSTSLGYGFNERRRGFDVFLGKEIGEYNKATLTYKLEEVKISDISDGASADLLTEEGTNVISSMQLDLIRDTRDNIYTPTTGYILTGSAQVAGGIFGGDKDFTKLFGGGSSYYTFFEKLVLELKLRAGIVDAYSNTPKVPIYERFYAGGANTIRGYKERRIGPRDPNTGDPIGGESLLVGNIELTFPIIESLKGAVFYDFGNVWEKTSDFGDFGGHNYKHAVGVGVRIKTPIGPVKLDLGYPLEPAYPGDKRTARFHFSMTRGF